MKKIITVVAISIIFTTQLFAASKNPLKIFKKEILGGDAKKKCSKLKLEQLGYSCEDLESQKIEVDTLFN